MQTDIQNKHLDDEGARAAVREKQATLLNDIIQAQELKNDAELARLIEVSPPVISKLRHGRLVMGPGVLIAFSEATGRSTLDMKRFLGQRVVGDPRLEATQ